MSTTSDMYACDVCTFIQSIKRPSCEMCGTNNPNYFEPNFDLNAGDIELTDSFDYQAEDQVVQCFQCNYINIGSRIRICQGCGKNPTDTRVPFNDLFGPDDYDMDDNSNNDSDDIDFRNDNETTSAKSTEGPPENDLSKRVVSPVEKGLTDDQLVPYFNRYILILRDQQQQKQSFTKDFLHDCLIELYESFECTNDQPDGQLTFSSCQICCDEDKPMVTMKTCGHCVVCATDFNQYLSVRIRNGEILPWIPCPADSCSVPCHVKNIIEDGSLTYSELLSFLIQFMLKKLSRNENFITCIQCEKSGFLQIGPPRKQTVVCPICNHKQTIEKGADGDLDINFKNMIKSGELRECPTCRHLTLKEKGICNVIQCTKCGIWWNWKTREQGRSGDDLKRRARISGTLWEPGELRYQQELEARNPKEFKALLERNGIKYDPNYIRGSWND